MTLQTARFTFFLCVFLFFFNVTFAQASELTIQPSPSNQPDNRTLLYSNQELSFSVPLPTRSSSTDTSNHDPSNHDPSNHDPSNDTTLSEEYEAIQWKGYNGSPFLSTEGAKQRYRAGKHTITATVCKKKPSSSCEVLSYSFEVTSSPPEKPILSMSPSKNLKRNTYLYFSHSFFSDPDGGTGRFEWKLNDGKWTSRPPNGTFPIGTHTISLRVIDETNQISEIAEKTFTITNSKPTKPSLWISPSSHVRSNEELTYAAASSDVDWDSFSLQWKVNNGSWTNELPPSHLPEGKHVISVRAIDEHQNISSVTKKSVLIQNAPPTQPKLEILSSSPYTIESFLSFKASESIDLDGEEIDYEWKLNDAEWVSEAPDGQFERGTHTVSVRAVDESKNRSPISTLTFFVENMNPSNPDIIIEPNETFTNLTSLTFKANQAFDPEKDELTYEWKIDNGNWSNKAPDGTYKGGDYTVYLRALDNYGGMSEEIQKTFTVYTQADSIEPEFSISPSTNMTSSTSLTFSTKEVKTIQWQWRINQNYWSSTPPNGTFKKGKYTVFAKGIDAFGKETETVSKSFTVTNSPPEAPLIGLPSSTLTTEDTLSFSLQSSDHDGDSYKLFWKVDDEEWKEWTNEASFPSYKEGTHTLYAKAVDEEGDPSVISETSFLVSIPMEFTSYTESFESTETAISYYGDWEKTSWSSSHQSHALKSSPLDHGKNSVISFSFTIPEDAINASLSFNWLVRSEENGDHFTLSLNDAILVSESGFGSWKDKTISLTPGSYTLKGVYQKNDEISRYDDAAFIDHITYSYETPKNK